MAYFDIGNFYECRNHKLGDEVCFIAEKRFFVVSYLCLSLILVVGWGCISLVLI